MDIHHKVLISFKPALDYPLYSRSFVHIKSSHLELVCAQKLVQFSNIAALQVHCQQFYCS